MRKPSIEGKCMFCNKTVAERTAPRLPHSRGDCEEIPPRFGIKVGERLICKDCCSELVSMVTSRLGS